MNDSILCPICMDRPLLPVKLRSNLFRCKRHPGKPSCHDVTRLCLFCARKYLHMDKPMEERPETIKCLTCPKQVDPRRIRRPDFAYERDWMLMAMDTQKDHKCFYSPDGCSFVGDQSQLLRHIQTQCSYRLTGCKCGKIYPLHRMREHVHNCSLYRRCYFCNETEEVFIQIDQVVHHVENVHHMKYCFNNGCTLTVPIHEYKNHCEQQCIFRIVQCAICDQSFMFHSLKTHMYDHLQNYNLDLQNKITEMRSIELDIHNTIGILSDILLKE